MVHSEHEIKIKIENELDKAEAIWRKVGPLFEKAERFSNFSGDIPSKIPGFPFLKDGKPEVADFIALVLDIRNSTNHLTQAISEKSSKASQLERVLYETTAVNTAGILIINEKNGGITEFLGDGFLAFFKVKDEKNPTEVYDAHNAAKKCLSITNNVINRVLYNRYQLPELKVGIGMAYSKAIVTIVGSEENAHPKAIGECVYRASKLSGGNNEIFIDDRLEALWPTSDNGQIKFIQANYYDFKAYKIEKNG
jgi:class 3 adenylate cyclase